MAPTNNYNENLQQKRKMIDAGGLPKYHEKLKQQNKLFVRDRLALLFDEGKYEEDGKFANISKRFTGRWGSNSDRKNKWSDYLRYG